MQRRCQDACNVYTCYAELRSSGWFNHFYSCRPGLSASAMNSSLQIATLTKARSHSGDHELLLYLTLAHDWEHRIIYFSSHAADLGRSRAVSDLPERSISAANLFLVFVSDIVNLISRSVFSWLKNMNPLRHFLSRADNVRANHGGASLGIWW